MKEKIWLSSPHMGGDELGFVRDAFKENWIAPLGPHVNGFEEDLGAFTGSPNVAALNSGTAGIHLALILLGVGPGDEVLCQSFTFSASANPIAYLGAKPIFVGSEDQTWNISPKHLKDAIEDRIRVTGKKPKAVIPVHLYGMPAQMPGIMRVANEYKIPVIEDAAEALGSSIDGKLMGTFGAIGILSFNGNKIITTSGGGALISENAEYVDRARFLATQARDPAPHYQHSSIGYNYRMSNICAGIGRGQMKVLPERIKQRRANFDFYRSELNGIRGFTFLDEPKGFYSNRWLSTLLIDPELSGISREVIRKALENENIESRPLWKPMHMQPVFHENEYYGDRIEEYLFERGLCLPSGSNLSSKDLKKVVGIIKGVL